MCEQGVLKGRRFNLSCKVKSEKLSIEHGELDIDGSKIRGSGGTKRVPLSYSTCEPHAKAELHSSCCG